MSIKITPGEWVNNGYNIETGSGLLICFVVPSNDECIANVIAISEVPNMIKVLEDVVSLNVVDLAQGIRNAENLLKRLKDGN